MIPVSNAKFVRNLSGFTGTAKLWRVSPPVPYEVWSTDGERKVRFDTDYVVTSATVAPFSGPETYIFPASKKGTILDWVELPGSYRGGLAHARAIRNLLSALESDLAEKSSR